MKMVILGAVRRRELDCWKDDIAEAGQALGWDVVHFNAKNVPTFDVVKECRDADILLWARTHSHEPYGDAYAMLREVEAYGCTTVALHLDLYWGVPAREQRLKRQIPWATCQYMFTADGGHQEEFEKLGIKHYWCPPPMGDLFYGRAEQNPNFPHKYVFVGSNIRSIHGPHRQQLLMWARRTFRNKFMHYGIGKSHVYGQHLNQLYADAHVVLGDSAPSPYYWSDRVVRTLGRGGLLAHPKTLGLVEQGFTPETMVHFERFDFQNLRDQIESLTTARRNEMIDNAMTVVRERHMWTNRLQYIHNTIYGE